MNIMRLIPMTLIWLTLILSTVMSSMEAGLLFSDDLEQASKLIDRMEGVYRTKFLNVTAAGKEFESENILEIVRISKDAVHFRTHMEFFNGNACELSGMARYSRKGYLIFNDPKPQIHPNVPPCTLMLVLKDDVLQIWDPDGTCKLNYCDAYGSIDQFIFPLFSRRALDAERK